MVYLAAHVEGREDVRDHEMRGQFYLALTLIALATAATAFGWCWAVAAYGFWALLVTPLLVIAFPILCALSFSLAYRRFDWRI